MSTKSTILCTENTHLYWEYAGDKLMLEITRDCGCTATIALPIDDLKSMFSDYVLQKIEEYK